LPERWESRPLRVAMSESDWARFEALVLERSSATQTRARACGEAISDLMHHAPPPRPEPGPLDWMDWERRKALRLLHRPSGH
jgi:hypothetical protein